MSRSRRWNDDGGVFSDEDAVFETLTNFEQGIQDRYTTVSREDGRSVSTSALLMDMNSSVVVALETILPYNPVFQKLFTYLCSPEKRSELNITGVMACTEAHLKMKHGGIGRKEKVREKTLARAMKGLSLN